MKQNVSIDVAAFLHTNISQTCKHIGKIVFDMIPWLSDVGTTNTEVFMFPPNMQLSPVTISIHCFAYTTYHCKIFKSVVGSNVVNRTVHSVYYCKKRGAIQNNNFLLPLPPTCDFHTIQPSFLAKGSGTLPGRKVNYCSWQIRWAVIPLKIQCFQHLSCPLDSTFR